MINLKTTTHDSSVFKINVIIEICQNNSSVKYEFCDDKKMMIVDRFMTSTIQYPCNYGFIPYTLSSDGDPIDALVITPMPINNNVVIESRPIGILNMEDEAGLDCKIIAVPIKKITSYYDNIHNINDLPSLLLDQIKFFFENYKKLDNDKWTIVKDFDSIEASKKYIKSGINKYKNIKL